MAVTNYNAYNIDLYNYMDYERVYNTFSISNRLIVNNIIF